MPLSVPGSPGSMLKYFSNFSLIPRDFLDLIEKNPSHISLHSLFTKESAEILSFPPLKKGSCEKIDLVLFGVIPAKAGIQVFHGLTN
jgi:hypothetical protein